MKAAFQRDGGFTLVETVSAVLLAGVVTLMGIGWYSNAMDRANTVKCTGNLRAIVNAAVIFATERDGRYWTRAEVGYSKYRMVDDPLGLPELLKEYVSKKVWLCPSGRKSLTKFGNNYTWNATKSLEEDNYIIMKSFPLLVWDTYNYSLPSMYNASEDFKGDGTSATGPTALSTKYHSKPHKGKTAANWGYADGSVVCGATATK